MESPEIDFLLIAKNHDLLRETGAAQMQHFN